MPKVLAKSISSRLGRFCLLKIGDMVLLTPCDTRMKIIKALSKKDMTTDELAKKTGAAYSTIVDHIEVLEKVNVVCSFLRLKEGRRRIHFKLNEKPSRSVNRIFASR